MGEYCGCMTVSYEECTCDGSDDCGGCMCDDCIEGREAEFSCYYGDPDCDCYTEAARAAEYCGCGDINAHYGDESESSSWWDEEYADEEFDDCDCEMCRPDLYEDADDAPFVLYEEDEGAGKGLFGTETVAQRFKRRYPNILRPGVSDRLGDLGKFKERVAEAYPDGVTIEFGTPEAPEGYEWVLMPARPDFGGSKAPGETGHYSDLNPEPIQVSEAWDLNGSEHSALKYLARYKKKGGVEDLQKVKFYADRLIAREIREGRA